MPSCRKVPEAAPVTHRAPQPPLGVAAHGGSLAVTNLAVERRLRRMAMRRTGDDSIEAAFGAGQLDRLRLLLTFAEQAHVRAIDRKPRREYGTA